MNIFNRILIVILMLFLIVSSIVIIVNIFANLFETQDIATRIVVFSEGINPWVAAGIAFGVLAVSIVILVFQFYRRKVKVADVTSDQTGKTMVSVKTVSSQIQEKLTSIEGIIDPKVRIVPMREGIIIETSSRLLKGINVAEITKQIRDTASEFASSYFGFKVMKSNYTALGFVEKKEPQVSRVVKAEEPEESSAGAEEMLEKEETEVPGDKEDSGSNKEQNK